MFFSAGHLFASRGSLCHQLFELFFLFGLDSGKPHKNNKESGVKFLLFLSTNEGIFFVHCMCKITQSSTNSLAKVKFYCQCLVCVQFYL